jgi:hypothetical protein
MADDVHVRFNAAFPWFDHSLWAWSYDPVESGDSPWYRISNAPPDASGEIAIYMLGATHEQCQAVERWLISEFNPKRDVPATHLLPKKMPVGHRHGTTLPPLR